MLYGLAADAVVLIHLLFILFVAFGGLLALHDRRWMFLHLPAAAWGAFIELFGGLCPLTPLENLLRERAGRAVYDEGFIDHYLLPLIYPEALSRRLQLALGLGVLLLNLVVYWLVACRYRSRP